MRAKEWNIRHGWCFVHSHMIERFFADYYDYLIIERGVRLADMIVLRRNRISPREVGRRVMIPGEGACVPSNVVRLRTMERADVDALTDLLRRVWYAEGDPGTQSVVARADLEFCMARATAAVVVECDGRPAGVCLARIDGGDTRPLPINRHHITACRSMLRLLRSAEGRRSASELVKLGMEGMMLSADARRRGWTYQAEVILLILDPSLQGTGIGARMLDHMEREFRAADVRRYFLYTNTDCNVGFYDRRGLNRRITHVAHAHDRSVAYYLYDASVRR